MRRTNWRIATAVLVTVSSLTTVSFLHHVSHNDVAISNHHSPSAAVAEATTPTKHQLSFSVKRQSLRDGESMVPSLAVAKHIGRGNCSAGPDDRVTVCLISHGWNAAGYHDDNSIKGPSRSLATAVRALIQTTQCALHIIFITGTAEEEKIRLFITPLKRWPWLFTFEFVPLNTTQVDEWMSTIGHVASHRTGHAGNVKFFYPLLLPRIKRVMMLDTDVIVARNVCELWRHFDQFPPGQLYSLAPQFAHPHKHKDNQYNAGVGLLHLDRMRRARWLSLAKRSIIHWHDRGMKPACCAHGDQSVFHMVKFFLPATMAVALPRWWNINKCHQYQGIRSNIIGSKETVSFNHTWWLKEALPKNGAFIGIVHLGCCKMCTLKKLGRRWAELFSFVERSPLAALALTVQPRCAPCEESIR
jgi:hypothetical protein